VACAGVTPEYRELAFVLFHDQIAEFRNQFFFPNSQSGRFFHQRRLCESAMTKRLRACRLVTAFRTAATMHAANQVDAPVLKCPPRNFLLHPAFAPSAEARMTVGSAEVDLLPAQAWIAFQLAEGQTGFTAGGNNQGITANHHSQPVGHAESDGP